MKSAYDHRLQQALQRWANEEAQAVDKARHTGDERALSLAQTRKSLLEWPNGMVAAACRMGEDTYARVRAQIAERAEKHRAAQDYDALERSETQLDYLDRARVLAAEIEAGGENDE